ncbi:MAG TPA: class I SAM-dependent methyltransferase [Acidimicrobiales bacterium]|nr:class I SAM-dependent methyltransferase [Acidimicrobiales bacterium]
MLTVDFRRLGLRPGERVLDVGCGGGRHAAEARRLGAHVVALDLSDVDVKDAAGTLDAVAVDWDAARAVSGAATVGDALSLPFADGAFDRVVAAEVFEHLPTDRAAFAECARVLRPGGALAVTVPRWFPELICWALSEDLPDLDGGHARIYRRSGLTARLAEVGLVPRDRHHAHALHAPYWWLRCAAGPVEEDSFEAQDDESFAVRTYRRFLEWHIVEKPAAITILERVLNPLLGKSLVVYADKPL